MAGITVFSVEVFNALFVAKAMQSAGLPLTNVLLIALDIFHGVRSFHRMSKSMTQLSYTMDLGNENLVQAVLTTCQQPGIVTTTRNEIRVRSSLQHSLSVNGQSLISQIERYQATPAELNLRLDQIPSFPYHNSRKVRDAPAKSESKASSEKDAMVDTRTASLESNAQKQEFVWQALRLLFQCEYHALVEYVECVIPVVYTIYVSILCQLPSSNYQPETMNLTTARFQTMISNVLIYASWELVSLVALHVAVKRRFGFSLLHLLAFVLESRFIEFQGRLLAIFSYIFSVTLVHFGSDLPALICLRSTIALALTLCGVHCSGVDFTLRFKQWESRDS